MENNLNIPPFYIGQKVEYITGYNMPKGTQGIVLDILKKECGCEMIKFSGATSRKLDPIQYPKTLCSKCGAIQNNSIIRPYEGYWIASSFKPLEEQKFPLISYSKVLEKEEVCAN